MLNEKQIEKLKEKYPSGTRIKLNYMEDDFGVERGTCGTIDMIDDGGNIHVTWDNGRTLALIDGVDNFEVINTKNDFEKVDAPIIDADSNVFNLIGICQRALKNKGYKKEAQEMVERVTSSKCFDEALQIMCEYVNPVSEYEYNYDSDISI